MSQINFTADSWQAELQEASRYILPDSNQVQKLYKVNQTLFRSYCDFNLAIGLPPATTERQGVDAMLASAVAHSPIDTRVSLQNSVVLAGGNQHQQLAGHLTKVMPQFQICSGAGGLLAAYQGCSLVSGLESFAWESRADYLERQ